MLLMRRAAIAVISRASNAALGLSGLALTYALTLTALGKYLVNYAARAGARSFHALPAPFGALRRPSHALSVNCAARADAQFASVERLIAFTRLEREGQSEGQGEGQSGGAGGKRDACHVDDGGETAPLRSVTDAPDCNGCGDTPLSDEWPTVGELELIDYRPAPYSPHVAPTLHPITLTFGKGEHVALVGRSGSGKSTLIAGLARLLPVGAIAPHPAPFDALSRPLDAFPRPSMPFRGPSMPFHGPSMPFRTLPRAPSKAHSRLTSRAPRL